MIIGVELLNIEQLFLKKCDKSVELFRGSAAMAVILARIARMCDVVQGIYE